MTDKFCKDCVHVSWRRHALGFAGSLAGHVCDRPVPTRLDLVSGEVARPADRWAYRERGRGWFRDRCGPEGKYWQAKP